MSLARARFIQTGANYGGGAGSPKQPTTLGEGGQQRPVATAMWLTWVGNPQRPNLGPNRTSVNGVPVGNLNCRGSNLVQIPVDNKRGSIGIAERVR